jgi:hypothetical protein
MDKAPKRIWVLPDFAAKFESLPGSPYDERLFAPYIHATPEALAAAPEVQALIAAARLVKPLVWELEPDRDADYPKWSAEAASGKTYHVFKAWWGTQNKWGFVGDGGFYHSEAEAKASYQADHVACILAALEPVPDALAALERIKDEAREEGRQQLLDEQEKAGNTPPNE